MKKEPWPGLLMVVGADAVPIVAGWQRWGGQIDTSVPPRTTQVHVAGVQVPARPRHWHLRLPFPLPSLLTARVAWRSQDDLLRRSTGGSWYVTRMNLRCVASMHHAGDCRCRYLWEWRGAPADRVAWQTGDESERFLQYRLNDPTSYFGRGWGARSSPSMSPSLGPSAKRALRAV